jgi:uncharacterized protein (DUF2252 family)
VTDDNSRVWMRAEAHADEYLRGDSLLARTLPQLGANTAIDLRYLVREAICSAFFVAYHAGVMDCWPGRGRR